MPSLALLVVTRASPTTHAVRSSRHSRARRVEPGRDQAAHRRLRIAAGDQALADQHRVGAPAGVGEQVARPADAGLGDPERRRWAARARSARRSTGSTSRVCRLRAFTPITVAPASSARSASSSVCTSTSAVMPSDSTRSSSESSTFCSSAATISSTRSAPCARASCTWYGLTMKSLRSTGTSTAARTASRSASEPPNRRSSVSTLITRAPAGGVLLGQLGRVGDGGQRPAGRAGPLDLGDHPDARARAARPARPAVAARRRPGA